MRKALTFNFIILFSTAVLAAGWTPQVSSSAEILNDVFFTGERTGWAAGNSGTILNTTDRGKTWSAAAGGTAQNLNGLFFFSENNGWAVGDNKTVSQYNGSSWTASQVGATANFDFTSVFMTGVGTAWVTSGVSFSGSLSNFRNIFYTNDGGTTWNSATISNSADASSILNYLYSIYFLDSSRGWAVGVNSAGTPAGKVFKTVNGGATWTDISPTGAENITLRDVLFLSSAEGWAAGGNPGAGAGYIFHTINGGATWETQFTFSPAMFRDLAGRSRTSLWASDRGSVFKFNGTNWFEESPPLSSGYFNRLFFTDAWNGWAAGGLLAAEGGPKRYIYKYVVDPSSLEASPRLIYLSATAYKVNVAVAGDNIESNAGVTLEGAGITVESFSVAYDPILQRNKINLVLAVPSTAEAAAGSYRLIVTNPDDGGAGSCTFEVRVTPSLAAPEEKPTVIISTPKIVNPNTDSTIPVVVGSPGSITSSGLRSLGAVRGLAADVELELLVYRFENGQRVYRRKFTADPDGYTVITLPKVADLGIELSEGIYSAVVLHPSFGLIGKGLLVVHYK